MLNQVILVGRLTTDVVVETLDDDRKKSTITLAIQRGYKNPETGEYDTDHVTCTLWAGMATNTAEYCKKGSTLGVKARLKSDDDGKIEVIAEKLTFINTKKD